jgi:RNA polymerase sigma-70 factor (ECF subfamily)
MQEVLDTESDRDRALVEFLRQGDRSSLAELVRRNERWIRAVVLSVTADLDLVEDAVQEVWISVWTQAGSLEDPARWRGWLGRLARNCAIDALRRKSTRKKYLRRFRRVFAARRFSSASPAERLEREEEQHRVLEAILELPEKYRQVVILRHLENWSYQSIAEALSLAVDSVETRLVRARRMLREKLRKRSIRP